MQRSGVVHALLGTASKADSGLTTYTGVTSNTTGGAGYKDSPYTTFQAVVTGTGALTATINIQCSNDGAVWCTTALGTITLSGSDSVSDGFTTTAPWKYVRAVLTNLTGTGATCYVTMGV